MLTRYRRWTFENNEENSVEALKEWLLRESEYQNIAFETIRGISERPTRSRNDYTSYGRDSERPSRIRNEFTHYGRDSNPIQCWMCAGTHPIWKCDVFENANVDERWQLAKAHKLCFRCLASTHFGQDCVRSQLCGIENCTRMHHKLLHKGEKRIDKKQNTRDLQNIKRNTDQTQNNRLLPQNRTDAEKDNRLNHELTEYNLETNKKTSTSEDHSHNNQLLTRDSNVNEEQTQNNSCGIAVSLRTIPIILKKGNRKVKVNALLDDGSTKSYINNDVANELNLHGRSEVITVGTLGANSRTFQTREVTFDIESVDGATTYEINAFTNNNVTGNLIATEWKYVAKDWEHLKNLDFSEVSSKKKVDLLIGSDYPDLHISLKEIRGHPGEPIARLTPLGWTCVGRTKLKEKDKKEVYFNYYCDIEENGNRPFNLEKFWEVEELEANKKNFMSEEESNAFEKVKSSIKKGDENRYRVSTPWKLEEEEKLPEVEANYRSAYNRLVSTEKSVERKGFKKEYSEVFHKYKEKGYIRKVENQDDIKKSKWFLPHFPIFRPDKETTKTRVVFDASAKHKGVCLNDFIENVSSTCSI